MKSISLMSFLVLCIAMSCRYYTEPDLQTNSPYAGSWQGNFSGEDSGTLNFTITSGGHVEGTKTSSSSNITEELKGYVYNDGKFEANTKSNFTIYGYISNNASVGNWSQSPNKGTYRFQNKLNRNEKILNLLCLWLLPFLRKKIV